MENNNNSDNNANVEISKIKLNNNEIYNIKDSLLRHEMNVLLGIEEPDERDK